MLPQTKPEVEGIHLIHHATNTFDIFHPSSNPWSSHNWREHLIQGTSNGLWIIIFLIGHRTYLGILILTPIILLNLSSITSPWWLSIFPSAKQHPKKPWFPADVPHLFSGKCCVTRSAWGLAIVQFLTTSAFFLQKKTCDSLGYTILSTVHWWMHE